MYYPTYDTFCGHNRGKSLHEVADYVNGFFGYYDLRQAKPGCRHCPAYPATAGDTCGSTAWTGTDGNNTVDPAEYSDNGSKEGGANISRAAIDRIIALTPETVRRWLARQ